jgi:hypothetical protein
MSKLLTTAGAVALTLPLMAAEGGIPLTYSISGHLRL